MIRITHHREKCIGCFYCAEVAPSRWTMDENDGKSLLKESSQKRGFYITVTSDDELEANTEAANVCPVNIIKVVKI